MFKANIYITLKESILDPKGKAAGQALQNLGLEAVKQTRIGKFVELHIDAEHEDEAFQIADDACRKLLANQVMENYSIEITEAKPSITS